MASKFPIGILSFNRPEMLRLVLDSLKSQEPAIDGEQVHLFQDGAWPEGSSEAMSLKEQNVNIFLSYFPSGTVHNSQENLGVAFNFDRAERFFFEKNNYDCAFFFEDDLVLSRFYIAALQQVAEYILNNDKISYGSAYGDHHASLDDQQKNATRIIPLEHKWGFALTRRQWLAQRGIVEGYLALLKGRNYRERPHEKIREYFRSLGFNMVQTSQDAVKDVAGFALGATKINTYACFGRYIGNIGLHTTPEQYSALGYEKTELFSKSPPNFSFPSNAVLDEWIKRARAHARVASESGITNMPNKSPEIPQLELAMRPEEAEVFKSRLQQAQAYLEFGCGGSTKVAAECSSGQIVSVDSDIHWIEKVSQNPAVARAIAAGRLVLKHVDIGPTEAWGYPSNQSDLRKWRAYYTAPWQIRDLNYDLILIDGRFRVMCGLMAAVLAEENATIAVHDYKTRHYFYVLEKYFDTESIVGNMAFFRRRKNINMRAWAYDFSQYMYNAS